MTQYKKKQDNFLRNILIGFGVIFMVLVLALTILPNLEGTKVLDYGSFDSISSYTEVSTQSENNYLVYYYSESCSHCSLIKSDVLEYADTGSTPIYFWEASLGDGHDYLTDLYGASITGTPTLVVVQYGVPIEFIVGSLDIPTYLNSIE
jgi:hypothetical protein